MWNFFRCYLSGRHDYGVGCEPGAIFLRCVHCGRRSSGWAVDQKTVSTPVRARAEEIRAVHPKPVLAVVPPPARARVIPFQRSAAAQ